MRTKAGGAHAGLLVLLGGLCAGVVGAIVADTVTTIVLFVLLTPATLVLMVFLGIQMLSLSQDKPRSWIAYGAIFVAALGPPLGTLAINIRAMYLAYDMTGATFWVPLAALAVNCLFALVLGLLAGVLVKVFG